MLNTNFSIKKKKTTDVGQWTYADNTFLPLRRRAASTLRPFLELIRARKPCTLLCLRFFGWYVRFIYMTPPGKSIIKNTTDSLAYYI